MQKQDNIGQTPVTNLEHKPKSVDNSGKAPNLPQFNLSSSSSQHHNDLDLRMNLSPELPISVAASQAELQQIVQQIQALYQEGPIVDGWLESDPDESPRPDYRLCGLDEVGNLWSHPCPPEQLPSVSVAIARYQKLLQLLKRKQQIENRLNELASLLVHTSIGSDG